ncbi:DUF1864 family protein [Allokutzneria sp. A3M-2-11 16]|uniref:monodechloroaminopyrrolnitrin synthase PrnB family protein n=1 Tax=Allokutzneria sp. A3M-2-11 16 TaxID=2962043 RepID=UPI0020B77475|nr:monodechloroaminopyrrolnitrin synthase PrnB family protein [Allokutzneria sp. A3M-2-11 16]MCP3805080.1 DUF1864 family protein [Allokutzneria sp. A3M-2-11 16]
MTAHHVVAFDRWLRADFLRLNTELEQAYFGEGQEIVRGRGELDRLAREVLAGGAARIAPITESGALPETTGARYRLLGAVGIYLAACRRHEVDGPSSRDLLAPAWSLATRLGASLGVAPRFVFAHLSVHNQSIQDGLPAFTALADEKRFIVHNGLAVLAYGRAAEALRAIPAMGVASPLTAHLLENARAALGDVLRFNRELADSLDARRFFLNVRPYFKSHLVGGTEYRGANAGDFAAINEIDLLLGLCSAADPFYQGILTEKYPYVPPEDQARLRACAAAESLLEAFLVASGDSPHLRANAEQFFEVCTAHAAAYAFHHHRLVLPFLVEPARDVPPDRLDTVTASGPPLEVVIGQLARLADLRAARDRPGLTTARAELGRLRARITPG